MAFWLLVPLTKTSWRGKVNTPEMCACNVTVPITSVPVTGVYCIAGFEAGFFGRVCTSSHN